MKVLDLFLNILSPKRFKQRDMEIKIMNEKEQEIRMESDRKLDRMIADLNGEDEWFIEIRRKRKEDIDAAHG